MATYNIIMSNRSEQLIEEVRKFKVLFDTNDENYLKSKLKDEIWSNIGRNLNFKDGNEAKTTWIKLRNCHRDALRRQKKCIKSGAPATAIKLWRYQKQMEFLLPFMVNRAREGNLDPDSDIDDIQDTENLQNTQELEETQHAEVIETEENLDIENRADNNSQELESSSNETTENTGKRSATDHTSISATPKNKKTKKGTGKKDDIATIIKQSMMQREKRAEERIRERKRLEETATPPDDHLYHFFMSMYEITKKMPFSYQHSVRNKVYGAVSQAEAECFKILDAGLQSDDYQHSRSRSSYTYTTSPGPHASYSHSSTPLQSPRPISASDNNYPYASYSHSSTPLQSPRPISASDNQQFSAEHEQETNQHLPINTFSLNNNNNSAAGNYLCNFSV